VKDNARTETGRQQKQISSGLRNALSVDVEDYFHVSALAGAIPRSSWDSMEYRVEANTHKLLELFGDFGASATFFVLGYVAQRSPELIREIHAAGHEVACHGLSHKLIYRQTPAEFEEETRVSKELLEDIIGAGVSGYRAASWSITQESLWALDIICKLGFRYDSSIFPIRHDRYGIPGASQHAGMISSPDGHEIVEFPPSTVSLPGVRLPVAGGGYFRIFPYSLTRFGLRRINKQAGQPFMFYLHPWEVDPEQPKFDTSRLSRFRHYTNLDQTELRLRRLLGEFQCTSAKNVLADLGLLNP
jgi:polysaccharide deacetylase family protein (PEP-CTERM system associated)